MKQTAMKKKATAPSTKKTTEKAIKKVAATQSLSPRIAKAKAMDKARKLAPDVPAPIGSTPKTKFRGKADIFGRLVEDHDRHRALLAMISATHGDSKDREKLFKELVLEISAHAAAEEQALWSSVMRHPKTTKDARHAVGEHKEMDKLLADLAARDMSASGWLRRFAKARDEYLHHIREEEQEQFLHAQKHLTDADVKYMATVFEERKLAEKAGAVVKKKIRLKS